MFVSKKQKIQKYLQSKPASQYSPFDALLSDYLDGALKEPLASVGLTTVEIHIDWHADYKCIDIQGRYGKYYFNLQIEPAEFSFCFASDEPDDHTVHPLESKEQLWQTISDTVKQL